MTTLKIYRDYPANSGSETDLVDTFIADGTSTHYTLVNKTGSRVASIILVGNQYFDASNGDFSVISNDIVFPSPPPSGAIIIVPGINSVIAGIVFDQDGIPGVVNPRIISVAAWVGDTDTIDLFSYSAAPGNSGIKIEVADLNVTLGADPSWVQFAPALVNGAAGTYQSAGTPIYLAALSSADALTAPATASGTSITIADTTTFTAGQWVKIGTGTSFPEVVQITAIPDSVTLTVSPLNYNHSTGATVFNCLIKFWIKVIVPVNAAGGNAINLVDNALKRTYVRTSKF